MPSGEFYLHAIAESHQKMNAATEYEIVSAATPEALVAAVNAHLKAGWQPHGGLVYHTETAVEHFSKFRQERVHVALLQPMLRVSYNKPANA